MIGTNNIKSEFPLTNVQAAYYLGRQKNYLLGNVATHVFYEFETELDIPRFNNALNKVIKAHPMLRTIIVDLNKQVTLDDVPDYVIPITDLNHLDETEQEKYLAEQRETISHRVLPPDTFPLFSFHAYKIKQEKTILFFDMDLLIADGSSILIFFNEIFKYYENEDLPITMETSSFQDFVDAQQQYKTTKRYNRDKKYWESMFDDTSQSPDIPLKIKPSEATRHKFQRLQFDYPAAQWNKLKDLANEKHISTTLLLFTAYEKLLQYWSNQDNFVLNYTISNRITVKENRELAIGDYTSLLLVPVNNTHDNFWDQCEQNNKMLMEGYRHCNYDGIDILKDISKNYHNGQQVLMPIVFTSLLTNDNSSINCLDKMGKIRYSISQTPQVYLDCQLSESANGLTITWDYLEELFDPAIIEKMFSQFTKLVDAIVTHENPCTVLTLPEADQKLLTSYNQTSKPITETTLASLLAKQFDKKSDTLAVKDANHSITYNRLDKLSNTVAKKLKEQNIKRGDFIAISASKSVETIINIIGVVKSGAAFVPINPEHPVERQEYIIKQCGCKCFLKPDDIDLNNETEETVLCDATPDSSAYVIYTSGSTGEPKGVEITNKAVCNTLEDINERFHIDETDRIIQISSFCFDLSIYDIFGSLMCGAQLHIIPDARDIPNILNVIRKEKITIWNTVPAIMELLMNECEREMQEDFHYYWELTSPIDVPDDIQLRVVMMSGDWIPLNLPDKIKRYCPDADIYSLGGATEASIWSIYYPIETVDTKLNSIPYGYPLRNQTIYIMNAKDQECPVGVIGEICIGGIGVAKGYRNDVERTNAAFIQTEQYGYIYRTGDYGVMHASGYVEFLGRKDSQVKIAGHRIELGEIENTLNNIPAIKNSCVTVQKDSNTNENHLVAYYISDAIIEKEVLRKELSKFLPHYMVPNIFVRIAEIPLSPNGKVNKKLLPSYDFEVEQDTYVAPRNQLEEEICELWKSVLKKERVGIYDNFFQLGGDSVKTISVYSQLKKYESAELKIKDFFDYQTVASLATYINQKIQQNTAMDTESTKDNSDSTNDECTNMLTPELYQSKISESVSKYRAVERDIKNVLITGATGYLGAYLIRSELNRNVDKITMIIRGTGKEDALFRLKRKLDFYFGEEFFQKYKDKFDVYAGDIVQPNLGLSQYDYNTIAESVDAIINAAANVSHFGDFDKLYAINAGSLNNIIDFALHGKKKGIYHISSSQILGDINNEDAEGVYTEFNYNINQTFNDYYCQTKFMAEGILLNAIKEHNLDAKIFRVGNIVFDSQTGHFQENYKENTFYCIVKTILQLQCAPENTVKNIDFGFVDYVSESVCAVVHNLESDIPVLHIMNENKISMNDMIELLNQCGQNIRLTDAAEFTNTLQRQYEETPDCSYLQNVLINAHVWNNKYDVLFQTELTSQELNTIGFQWPTVNKTMINAMYNYVKELDFK